MQKKTTKNLSPKVAFIGNIGNNFFREVGGIRKFSRLQADLFFENGPDIRTIDKPWGEDPGLVKKLPNWIIAYKEPRFREIILGFIGLEFCLSTKSKALVKKLAEYDLLIFSGNAISHINLISNKSVIRPTGSDMTVLPILKSKDYNTLTGRKISIFYPLRFLKWYLRKLIFKLAYKKANYVFLDKSKPFIRASEKLQIPTTKILNHPRLAINTDRFKRRNISERRKIYEKWGLTSTDFLVFFPSRIMIKKTPIHESTGQWKASESALWGFKSMLGKLTNTDKAKVKILIPYREESPCFEEAMNILKKGDMLENATILRRNQQISLSRIELIEIYSISSVVLDDFGVGWYGSTVVESLSCECPVISHVEKNYLDSFCAWHPLQLAQTAQEISIQLIRIHQSKLLLTKLRKSSRKWIKQYHSERSAALQYECLIEGCLN